MRCGSVSSIGSNPAFNVCSSSHRELMFLMMLEASRPVIECSFIVLLKAAIPVLASCLCMQTLSSDRGAKIGISHVLSRFPTSTVAVC
jgi:hypothetical protein